MRSPVPAKSQPSTLLYRYLLLLLLPFIAAIIYVDGQRYDPGLLDFSKSDEMSSPLLDFFPEKTSGLVRQGRARLFAKDNLYEYINGHAEYFISSGFKSLAVAEYGESAEKSCCTADIYDMGAGANAFGVLMGEINDDFTKIDRGFMGFISPRMLSFSKGPYYVKIGSFSDGAPLETVAAMIDEAMGDIKTDIPQLKRFPESKAIAGSLRYFKEAYRGIDFLNNVFEKDYLLNDKKLSLALMTGDSEQLDKKLSRLLGFLKSEEIAYEEIRMDESPYYRIKDPFEGDWLLLPGKKEFFMIYGIGEEPAAETFIREIWGEDDLKR